MPVRSEAHMPHHARAPADAGLDQQVAMIRPIAQRLDVLDVGDARDLRDGILQQAWRGIDLVEYPRECRQSLLIAQGLLGIDQTRLARKRARGRSADLPCDTPCRNVSGTCEFQHAASPMSL